HDHPGVTVTTSGLGEKLGRGMARLASQGRAAHECLQAAALAAVVQGSVGVDDHVADLARGPVPATVQLAVDDQPATHAGRPCDGDHVSGATTGAVVAL